MTSSNDNQIICHSEPVSANTYDNNIPVILLIGMPNSGKTTLFNTLTGANYKTSNYPGATVEYSQGKLTENFNIDAIIIDSPGIISLNPSSPDEEVTIEGLFNNPKYGLPDLVIVTCDSTQISRQLFLVHQLIESGFNTIVALTMNDILMRKSLEISEEVLKNYYKIPFIKINSVKRNGIEKLIEESKRILADPSLNQQKLKIKKPHVPSIEEIAKLYELTEEIEKKAIIDKSNSVNIDEINKKVFRNITRTPDKRTLKLDRYLLHPFWGIIIFFISMGILFSSIFWIAQPLMDIVDTAFSSLSSLISNLLPKNTWYSDLITNGLINGFGSVMVFVPQIVILFILLGLLEDTGYLARAAMLIDKPLSKFGLNGKSFIPMLSGYACAIPAILSARTISNRRERFLTIMIIPLMSCSARLPVYALLLAFLVPPDKAYIAGFGLGALYFFSIVSGIFTAGIINKFRKSKEKSTFMLELPPYRIPVLKHIIKTTYYKALIYVKQAGPLIIIFSLILWALTYFPNVNPELSSDKTKGLTDEQIANLENSERLNTSYAATIGKNILEPIIKPLGWDWRIGVSLISAFAAREIFVSAMAITFSITESNENEEDFKASILTSMKEAKSPNGNYPLFTTASTISLIIYFMFAMQCLSTIAVSRKETASWKIPVFQIVIYSSMAYIFAFISYNGLKILGIH
jgi:ferrous iron transport protein B